MRYIIGFVIALFIALTGVGAGTITVPVPRIVRDRNLLKSWMKITTYDQHDDHSFSSLGLFRHNPIYSHLRANLVMQSGMR
jgi:hypothetical protein